MYAYAAAALLALAGSAVATPISKTGPAQEVSPKFRLSASGGDLIDWQLIEAHTAAGTNVIEIQRPSAFDSDKSYLLGTQRSFNHGTSRLIFPHGEDLYGFVVNVPEAGSVNQVFTKEGAASSKKQYGINTDGELEITLPTGQSSSGFWACPTEFDGEEVFTLFFGQATTSATGPTGKACTAVTLSTTKKF